MASVTVSNISSSRLNVAAKSSINCKFSVNLVQCKNSKIIKISINPEQFVQHWIAEEVVSLADKQKKISLRKIQKHTSVR